MRSREDRVVLSSHTKRCCVHSQSYLSSLGSARRGGADHLTGRRHALPSVGRLISPKERRVGLVHELGHTEVCSRPFDSPTRRRGCLGAVSRFWAAVKAIPRVEFILRWLPSRAFRLVCRRCCLFGMPPAGKTAPQLAVYETKTNPAAVL